MLKTGNNTKNIIASAANWTNNACESINHVLKQRLQWRVAQLADLVDHLCTLLDAQYKEADRALCGRGEYTVRLQYARHRLTDEVWVSMTEVQRQRSRDACFNLQGGQASISTYGDLTIVYKSGAGKKHSTSVSVHVPNGPFRFEMTSDPKLFAFTSNHNLYLSNHK